MKVLLIEDSPEVCKAVELALAGEGIVCDIAATGKEGVNFGQVYEYNLIILDLMLPDMDGFDVLKKLRAAKSQAPVLILSGLTETTRKIEGLGIGADDYLTKPFDMKELIARIQAVIRRSSGHSENHVTVGSLVIDFNTHTTRHQQTDVKLTAKEQEVLELMALKRGNVISKESFLNHLYNGLDEPDMKIIDVFICKMRKKLEAASGGINYIQTIWGRGYVLKEPQERIANL